MRLSIIDAKTITDSALVKYMQSSAYGVQTHIELFTAARAELRNRLVDANSLDDVRRIQGAIQAIDDVLNILDAPEDFVTRT